MRVAAMNKEPAVLIGLAQALIAVAVAFGLDLNAEQIGVLYALMSAVSAVIVRQRVSPTGGSGS